MSVTEDASTPGTVTGTGAAATINSAPFAPPSASLLVAMVSGEWSSATPTVVITDSSGGTWLPVARNYGSGGGGGICAIYIRYLATAPGTITVTATFTNLGGGRLLDVRVCNGADPVQSVGTGWSQSTPSSSLTTGQIAVVTTAVGSVVYGISDAPDRTDTFTANGATTPLTVQTDTADQTGAATWKAVTASVGSITLGGTWSAASEGIVCAFEVTPVGSSAVPPALPTFTDGTVPTAADLNAVGTNIKNLYKITTGGQRYAPYSPGGKGPIKPLTVMSVTNPNYLLSSAGATLIRWDTVLANSDNAWSPLDSGLFVVNTPGLYRMHLQANLVTTTVAELYALILINGTTVSTNGVAATVAYGTAIGCSATVELAALSTIYCAVDQFTGVNVGVGLLQFCLEWLGP